MYNASNIQYKVREVSNNWTLSRFLETQTCIASVHMKEKLHSHGIMIVAFIIIPIIVIIHDFHLHFKPLLCHLHTNYLAMFQLVSNIGFHENHCLKSLSCAVLSTGACWHSLCLSRHKLKCKRMWIVHILSNDSFEIHYLLRVKAGNRPAVKRNSWKLAFSTLNPIKVPENIDHIRTWNQKQTYESKYRLRLKQSVALRHNYPLLYILYNHVLPGPVTQEIQNQIIEYFFLR